MLGLGLLRDAITSLAGAISALAATARAADALARERLQLDAPPPAELLEANGQEPAKGRRGVKP